jgi:plastocyanin
MRTVTTVRSLAMLVVGAATLHATSRSSVARESTHAPVPREVAVSIRTFQFTPDTVRVTIGARVVWTNTDDIEHTITSGTPDTRDGRFDGVVDKGGTRDAGGGRRETGSGKGEPSGRVA